MIIYKCDFCGGEFPKSEINNMELLRNWDFCDDCVVKVGKLIMKFREGKK